MGQYGKSQNDFTDPVISDEGAEHQEEKKRNQQDKRVAIVRFGVHTVGHTSAGGYRATDALSYMFM